MGMSDTVIVLDDLSSLACPYGHSLRSFQTKDLDEPSMNTYLIHGGCLYLASRSGFGGAYDDEPTAWRLQGDDAVLEHRFKVSALAMPRTVRIYTHCGTCEPVLVRTDKPAFLHDIVSEHRLFVDFIVTFRQGEPVQIERTTGNRDDIKADLRRRGLVVLDEAEPLAIAHREIKRAQERPGHGYSW
jgi:hypothetical protein